MNFELEYLWNLYAEQSGKGQNDKQKQNLLKELNAESERLKKVFLFFSPQPDQSLTAFIQFQQHSLSRLLLSVENSLGYPHADDTQPPADLNFPLILDALLDFLNCNFPKEFDLSARASSTCLSKEKKSQEASAELIDKKFEERQINKTLRDIINTALSLSDRETFTYADLGYIHSLSASLLKNLDELNSEQAILNLLKHSDFNKPDFLDFLQIRIHKELENALEISERYKALLILKKETEQSIYRKPGRYSLLLPPLVDVIIEYLESERMFLKEMEMVTTEWVNSGMLDASYKVSLTVKQLAFYIYLNVECGTITEQRAKKIHQYAIAHVDSHEKSGISEKSFKNAYYLHHPEDIKKVLDKIAKMLAIARERY